MEATLSTNQPKKFVVFIIKFYPIVIQSNVCRDRLAIQACFFFVLLALPPGDVIFGLL